MDKQQALRIVEGLRSAQASGAPVIELLGSDARDFVFVRDDQGRKNLLGSFGVEVGKKFFVSVVSTPRSDDSFQFMVFERLKHNPVLTTSYVSAAGLVWTYQPTKQTGDNQARKRAFLEAANAESLAIPFPDEGLTKFSAAVLQAIELRRLADAAGGPDGGPDGGDDNDDEAATGGAIVEPADLLTHLYSAHADRRAALAFFAQSLRVAHATNPKSWCVTNPGGADKLRLNVGGVRVLDLFPGLVRIAVDASMLGEPLRAGLGDALDLSPPQRLAAFGDNGVVKVTPAAIAAMPGDVVVAHTTLVQRAATSNSLFARFHQPSIVEAMSAFLGEQLPSPASEQAHYWKVSPGENAEMWAECRDGNFIAVGWDKLGDLTSVDHAEFKQRSEAVSGSDQVWKFRNIAVGDRIVANDGTTRVLGIGTVTGPYYFAAGQKRCHRLPVHWDDTHERTVSMKGWIRTLIRLSQDTFKQIQGATVAGTANESIQVGGDNAGPNGAIDFEDILSQLSSRSLSFSAELVASYLLALQAKRFVLLTGISGTGKTRLAQEVARLFGPPLDEAHAAPLDVFELVTKPSQLKYSRFVVPSQLAQEFDALTNPEIKRIDLKVPGLPMASMAFHKHADGGNLFYVLLSGEIRQWFATSMTLGARFRLSRKTSGDKEWLDLTLPSGSPAAPAPAEKTYELIAVRPDWTDSRALLGFYNPLTRSYVSTPTLRLLLQAHADVTASTDTVGPRPYFLIFDEMNLARVEHYFSDFLSAMESGEAIHLHDDPRVEEEDEIPRRLMIPRNVFVVGTVNVDETTYMFSPKVLDRAFVLEFNDVNLDGLAGNIPTEEASSTPLALSRMENGLTLRGRATEAEWLRFEKLLDGEPSATLRKMHQALMLDNRHFGYRVAGEIARFVDLASEQTDGAPAAVRAAIDVAVLAKILPKLHGAQSEIEAILKRLSAIATGDRPDADVFTPTGEILDAVAHILPLPRTARKLWRMQRRLRAHGFVSFIE